MLEASADLGLRETIYVDAATLIAVAESLPSDKEIKLQADEGVLNWKCGHSRGKLALAGIDSMRDMPRMQEDAEWTPKSGFIAALNLGRLSCSSDSLASAGMYGVVVDSRGKNPIIISSDNTTVSSCEFVSKGFAAPDLVTLNPLAVALMGEVIKQDVGKMTFADEGVHYVDDGIRCYVSQVSPLKYDLAEVRKKFRKPEMLVPLPRERVMAFTKRAAAMAESRRHVYVSLGANKGRLTMTFTEGVAQSDEWYLIDEVKVPEMTPIKLDAMKLARALQHVDMVALDFIEREQAVLLRSDNPKFEYLMSGHVV